MYFPTREHFKRLARESVRVPIFKEIPLGDETTVSIIEKLNLVGEPFALFESGKGGENQARYSFLGIKPFASYKSRGKIIEIFNHGECKQFEAEPFEALQSFIKEMPVAKYPGLPKFYGGGMGYFSYDIGRFFEILPVQAKDDLELPEAYFMFFDKVFCFDHLEQTIKIIVHADLKECPDEDNAYFKAINQIEIILAALQNPLISREITILQKALQNTFAPECNVTKKEFEAMVTKAKAYIRAGDIFQVNLSLRLAKELKVPPFFQYKVLREVNPSPYCCYIDFGDLQIVGSSPELLVKLTEDLADTRPIAGTRRRGANREEDLALANELISNEKERAEHVMLVDLERNDLGRVCRYGTVEVNELMVIEEYSHVMHIVSNVRGRLQADKNGFDLFKACFPGGTITGAPKIRSMEIIEELEPTRRGIYTGSVGYLGLGGELEMNISIRTFIVKDGKAYVQAGAGIVADSDPEREYFESMKKAEALLRALEIAEELYLAREEVASA